jgi:hypothetical protein
VSDGTATAQESPATVTISIIGKLALNDLAPQQLFLDTAVVASISLPTNSA